MNRAQKIHALEGMLARVQKNRQAGRPLRAVPSPAAEAAPAVSAAVPTPPTPKRRQPIEDDTPEIVVESVPPPAPEPAAESAMVASAAISSETPTTLQVHRWPRKLRHR